ncbi:hypothetical protein LSTR_LSTR015745 [Laodelphax striatellus]|uniref:Uncharacterized protein n=1 Tax=Laodelphax striatellus TaxID=195883 RepID=A0A482XB58_LAOST|nr:hypothetical protein LSTR_LSTR015745 [Laodelphax striatellus]
MFSRRSSSCQSTIEIYDGLQSEGRKPTKKICSPSTKHAQDPSGKFHEQQLFVSSGPILNILLRRLPTHQASSQSEPEFLDGAYVFHDEHVSGTLQPDALCNVDYFGMSASTYGTVTNAGNQHVFWNVEGPLQCSHRFIPAANQSATVQLVSLGKLRTENRSEPVPHEMRRLGCQCCTLHSCLYRKIDHIMLSTDNQLTLSCICGKFRGRTGSQFGVRPGLQDHNVLLIWPTSSANSTYFYTPKAARGYWLKFMKDNSLL